MKQILWTLSIGSFCLYWFFYYCIPFPFNFVSIVFLVNASCFLLAASLVTLDDWDKS